MYALFIDGWFTLGAMAKQTHWYCRNCAYELTELAEEGVCPECGGAYAADQRKGFRVRASRRVCWWPMWFALVVFGAGLFADIQTYAGNVKMAFFIGAWWVVPLAAFSVMSLLVRRSCSSLQLLICEIIPIVLYVALCVAFLFDGPPHPDPLNMLAHLLLPIGAMGHMVLIWVVAIIVTGFIEELRAR